MIIELTSYGNQQAELLKQHIRSLGISCHTVPGQPLLIAGNTLKAEALSAFADMIVRTVDVDTTYQLASKKFKEETILDIKGAKIGAGHFQVIAGPCSIESEEQIFETARLLSALGIPFIRGGAFKPRTSPYTFRGMGMDGLKLIHQAARQYNLRVVSELMDLKLLDKVEPYIDLLQIGSRNMQNFYMLNELGKLQKPVMLKRGMSARVKEWLLAAEYILSAGNQQVILCERGIRSFDPDSRNVMDLGVIPLIKELSHLPIISDPSHGTGIAARVLPMALASVAVGADGLMIEIHPEPAKALSDSQQALTLEQFEQLMHQLTPLIQLMHPAVNTEGSVFKLQSL
ncbi:MAG: 3-deoxy-7-phosphoheptulonate synthase [Bacteroidia bacterium]